MSTTSELLDTLTSSMPWSERLTPSTPGKYWYLWATNQRAASIPLPAGVHTVTITWNGAKRIDVFHAPTAGGSTVVARLSGGTASQPVREVLTLHSDGTGRMHVSGNFTEPEVSAGNLWALVQVYPTPLRDK